ncbi:hypothetical protein BpHYR1_009571 [Brachionus plicatilis]|uniref:Uncharacterized protein n=1 Tax=Brachionus plicatilis TaxID=10195 RepID=A0A3M7T8V6_BRAPC|nr:hypothetical protein BpHYR1_009571 [Brachionus plicatilis]
MPHQNGKRWNKSVRNLSENNLSNIAEKISHHDFKHRSFLSLSTSDQPNDRWNSLKNSILNKEINSLSNTGWFL